MEGTGESELGEEKSQWGNVIYILKGFHMGEQLSLSKKPVVGLFLELSRTFLIVVRPG